MSARNKFIALTAGFWREHTNTWMCTGEDIETFAALIRADEREACAKACDEYDIAEDVNSSDTAEGIALAIRARENT